MTNIRRRILLWHVVDSILVSIIGGTLVFGGLTYIVKHNLTIQEFLENYRNLIVCSGAFILILIGWQWPKIILSSISGIRVFPYHWGLAIRTPIGLIVVYCCVIMIEELQFTRIDFIISILILAFAGGLLWLSAAYSLALRLNKRSTQSLIWDDRPIEFLKDNKYPDYEAMARIILKRLVDDDPDTICGNVALIGPYGSGKTSICNMVQDIYENEKNRSRVLFCRYEAWQYLDDDTAIIALINTLVECISDEVDVPELRNIPDRYVQALKEGGALGRCFAALYGGHISPQNILERIGSVLERLDWRIVIYVDDLDRIEGEQATCHRAIIRSLNQLQKISHVMYVICVGGMELMDNISGGSDLLKLTRYQELVPRIDPETLSRKLQDERELVLSDNTYDYPWSYTRSTSRDPLFWNPLLWRMEILHEISWFVELIDTPRTLKSVLREARSKWKYLRGEFNWYDLILLSALKSAEERVYEWILREQEFFIAKKLDLRMTRNKHQEDLKKDIMEIDKRLDNLLSRKVSRRKTIVKEVLNHLFPVFHSRSSESTATQTEWEKWKQNVSFVPEYGKPYIRRYIDGSVPSGEVPDQPILQYIRKIAETGFQKEEYENIYLSSYSKITHDLNRFIQFSGIISQEIGRQICDVIIDWICDKHHWVVWPPNVEPDYAGAMIFDINQILSQAGIYVRQIHPELFEHDELDDEHSESTESWIRDRIPNIVEKSLVVGIRFVQYLRDELLSKNERIQMFSAAVMDIYVRGNRRIWPEIRNKKNCLLEIITSIIHREGYGETERSQFTQKIISEVNLPESETFWEELVISLVGCTYPAGSPEKIEYYKISVDKSYHNNAFDMGELLPVIQGFSKRTFSIPLAKRAYQEIANAYGFSVSGS